MKVAVFGLGYVGAVTAAGLASQGHVVTGVDVDATKVDTINDGHGPVVEPGLDALIAAAVEAGRLRAATEAAVALDKCDVSLICVGTPSTARGSADLSYIERCLDDIHRGLGSARPPASGRHAIVIRSTVPPGTVDTLVQVRAAQMSTDGLSVGAGMCPEFLREGSGVHDFFHPELVVVGTRDADVASAVAELFAFLDTDLRVVGTRTAEALKYACNAFHATKVSFANEMGRVLRPLGVDSREVMALLCEDHVLNISPYYLRPGFAYGGSCLPKDLRSLVDIARQNSVDAPLLTGTVSTNELVLREVVDRLVGYGGKAVAMLGLSFKSDTDDLRESPYLEVAERLVGKGLDVRIFDSVLNPDRLVGANKEHVESRLPHIRRLLCRTPSEALAGADVAVVSAADQTTRAALVSEPPPRILDLSGRLGAAVEALPGYEGVGW
jgi:GDP-mannose 6-dehydrogenase